MPVGKNINLRDKLIKKTTSKVSSYNPTMADTAAQR